MERIVLAGGCFWCIESVFLRVKGVQSVVSGYAGGDDPAPTYEKICTGTTGHAEVIEVVYDSTQIRRNDLLNIFFTIHDPTTLNRQGNDIGTQYRSAVFYESEQERQAAQAMIDHLTEDGVFQQPIVTTLEPLTTFFPAEEYHQNYFNKNPGNPYCQFSVPPKTKKLVDKFADFVKPEL